MAQSFKESAHLHSDRERYAEGWERIFGKSNLQEQVDQALDDQRITGLSESVWVNSAGEIQEEYRHGLLLMSRKNAEGLRDLVAKSKVDASRHDG